LNREASRLEDVGSKKPIREPGKAREEVMLQRNITYQFGYFVRWFPEQEIAAALQKNHN